MELDFTGKHCLITGGSRGLGRAIAVQLAERGARVALTYSRVDEDAQDTATLIEERCGQAPLVFKGSVADSAHVREVTRSLKEKWGQIDVLVHAAALIQVLPLALLQERDFDELMAVNVKGPYLFSRAILKHMIRARQGKILFIGNFASERIVESPIHYAASKSALRGMCEAMAREVGRYDIQVNLLAPGLLEQGLGAMLPQHRVDEYLSQCPAGRLGTLQELAQLATFLVSDANSFMTGAKVVADGGL